MQKRNGSFVGHGINFLLGIVVGACIGILAAPTKGAVVRSSLRYNVKSYRQKLHNFIVKLMGNRNKLTNQAKDMGQEVITEVIHAAKNILQELDTLTEQLKTE